MQSWLSFELDGKTCRVEQEPVNGTLASFLAKLDPVFARFGRREAAGSPLLVALGDLEGDCHRFRAVDAARLLLPMVAGRQVWTPEGLLAAEPDHPVNLALAGGHFECGADRSGALRVLLFEGYYRPDLRCQGQTNDQFDAIANLSANVPAIRETAAEVFASTEQLRHEAAQRRGGTDAGIWSGRRDIYGDTFTKALFRMAPPAPFSYVDAEKRRFHRPGNLVELRRLLADYPDAQILAGGTLAVGDPTLGKAANLISLDGVAETSGLTNSEEAWEIGASVPLTRIAETIGRECPSLGKLLRRFASRPVRNRVTLGGHLATASGDAQLAPLLMALNARLSLSSGERERDVPVSQFWREDGTTLLEPGEIIRCLVLPRASESALAARGLTAMLADVYTVGARRNLSERYFTAAFALELRGRSVVKARLAYGGAGAAPFRAREVEEYLAGRKWGDATLFESLPILNKCVSIDMPGLAEKDKNYRKQLAVTLFQKFAAQHPRPDSIRPAALTAVVEFAKLEQPYYEALDA